MLRAIHIVLLFLFCSVTLTNAQRMRHSYKRSGHGWRYNIGTGLNNYTLNDKHGINPRMRMNFTAGLRRELRVTRDYKSYVLFGIEYILHGLNYQSYYFKPDSIQIYDRRYSYTYALTLQELHVPFEIKYLLRREDNSPFSPYLLFGYHLRYLLPAWVKVSRDGEIYQRDRPEMIFRTDLLGKKINASLCAALGWQINHMGDRVRSFFIEANFQYGFSDFYFSSSYSASSMYINCLQATLKLGAKF